MIYIDEKFKDNSPEKTVENIIQILDSIGIKLIEHWNDSGVEHCYSLNVSTKNGFPSANGKGVSPSFARASAYGEFIERLQTGLFMYKYQSLEYIPGMFFHEYAPDAKYMTKAELVKNGDWMDYLIDTYGGRLDRDELAEQCAMYANSDNILTLPFYSLFEDKYVYLPASFVEHIYSANGCCVGNSRSEAWIHALSEIMERHANISIMSSGAPAPIIPDEELKNFSAAYSVIKTLRESDYDVTVLDFSQNFNFPVVATRIISKKNGGYMVHAGADPVFEIALTRTLTETFQGKNLKKFSRWQTVGMLNNIKDFNIKHNILNQLETSCGKFTMDFFSEDIIKPKYEYTSFPDRSKMSNKEILPEVLKIFKDMNRPIYVRNYSILGFPCYKFVIPGFSESRGVRLNEFLQEYYFADHASKVLRYPEKATDEELEELLLFQRMICGAKSREANYIFLSGLPISAYNESEYLAYIHYAYAAFRLNRRNELITFLSNAVVTSCLPEITKYVRCLKEYFSLIENGVSEEQTLCLLKKLCDESAYNKLVKAKKDNSFFEGLLMRCDITNCNNCAYRDKCNIESARAITNKAGEIYSRFTDGQARENFSLDFEI